MRLTANRESLPLRLAARWQPAPKLVVVWLAVVMAAVFALDRTTDIPGVQHLYYLPIIVSAIRFGRRGGTGAAVVAIVLYHLANPRMVTATYEEADLLQMLVFIAAGLVSAKLADDARRLHQLAMTDDLTGLHNLRSFELEVRRMLRSAQTAGMSLSLLVVDVDQLKRLNDKHGHLTGSDAVRTVGRVIAKHIPASAVACRYGGDEFVIAVPDAPVASARSVADDLVVAVQARQPVLAGVPFPERTLSISVGLACRSFEPVTASGRSGADDATIESLFRAADAALYSAKNDGRNRVHVAAPMCVGASPAPDQETCS